MDVRRKQCNHVLKSSPDAAHSVIAEHRLVAHQRQILCLGLSDQHSVEWVLVSTGKQTGANSMIARNRKDINFLQQKMKNKLSMFRRRCPGR